MKRTVKEIKEDIQTLKDTIAVTDNAEEKAMLQEGIDDLEKELKKLSEKPDKPAKPSKVAPKVKKAIKEKKDEEAVDEAKANQMHPEATRKLKEQFGKVLSKREKFIKEGEKRQKVTDKLDLIMINENLYELVHDEVPEYEFERKGIHWHVQCKKPGKREIFASLSGAVVYVAKNIYKDELKKYIDEKKEAAKTARQRREKRKAAGKPAELTATETITKAVDAAVEKIENKEEKGKSVNKDIAASFSKFEDFTEENISKVDSIDTLKSITSQLMKMVAIIRKQMKKIGGKKMDEGGEVEKKEIHTIRYKGASLNYDSEHWYHPMTNSPCSLDACFSGFSEQDEEAQKEWIILKNFIKTTDMDLLGYDNIDVEDFINIEDIDKLSQEDYYATGGKVDYQSKCPVGMKIQTILFKKDKFTSNQAKAWLKEHDFKYGDEEDRGKNLRFRQEDPKSFEFKSLRNKKFTTGIKAVVGCPKK